MSDFYKLYSLFISEKKSQVVFLLFVMFGMAFFQTAGIASILPFISVLVSPEIISQNKYLILFYEKLNFKNQNDFLFFLGIGTLTVLIVSNIFSAYATRLLIRFTFLHGHSISRNLFKQYLYQPYIFFLNRNSADLIKNIIIEVDRCVLGVFSPALEIITRSIITLCILSLLIAMDPLLAFFIFLVCGGSYAIVYKISRQSLINSGKISADSQTDRSKVVNEAFGGIKDLKLLGREDIFFKLYSSPSYNFAVSQANNQLITELPKYALETIIFGGILLVMLYLIGIGQHMEKVLPLLTLYAFAGYRLMPAIQRIFSGFTAMRYYLPVLNIIYNDINEKNQQDGTPDKHEADTPILDSDTIILQNISYSYPNSELDVLKNINLTIKANSTVGIVGTTGSGKTTLIDLILGLLPISEGEFYIGSTLIHKNNLRSWQKNIGYVPQQIYLADDTVTRNIAFGISNDEIDNSAVITAANIANIHNLVSQELPEGYDTNLGERGIRLSGGQRQRIGIARALYHDPEVLILDEATSALDGVTEDTIMDAIRNLAGSKTIIMIAHRITTVKECDIIHVMENGKIIASGKYNELIASCDQFRAMAKSSDSSTVIK